MWDEEITYEIGVVCTDEAKTSVRERGGSGCISSPAEGSRREQGIINVHKDEGLRGPLLAVSELTWMTWMTGTSGMLTGFKGTDRGMRNMGTRDWELGLGAQVLLVARRCLQVSCTR